MSTGVNQTVAPATELLNQVLCVELDVCYCEEVLVLSLHTRIKLYGVVAPSQNCVKFIAVACINTFWLIWYNTKRAYVIMNCPSCIVVVVIVGICAQPS